MRTMTAAEASRRFADAVPDDIADALAAVADKLDPPEGYRGGRSSTAMGL
ncbi:hypothetical protein [Streptomonospora sp. PA3]|nr:hypothetical protein [Streptomonospora sp. PA3]